MLSSLFSGGLTLTLALAPVGAVTVEPTQIIRANSPTLQAQAIDLNST